jgi:hypothetical protein
MNKLILLGQTCNITFATKKLKINKESGIFEWVFSIDFDDIINLIENKFQDIDAEIRDKGNVKIKNTDIFTSHYKVEEYSKIIKRRSERFLEDIKSGKEILFMRIEFMKFITLEQVERFNKAILDINPDCKFKFLIIRHTKDESLDEVKHELVINKRLTKDSVTEPEENKEDVEWLEGIFKELNFKYEKIDETYGDKN